MQREQVIQYFDSLNYSGFKKFYEDYENYLKSVDPARIEPSVKFPTRKGELLGIDVRMNDDISFNLGKDYNNDLFIVMEITDDEHSIITHFVKVTCDPCRMKEGIAHKARQIYRGNIGFHRGDSTRICIRSDFGFGTWERRTHADGSVIPLNPKHNDAVAQHCGDNHHESPFANSSLTCTIWDEQQHTDIMEPLLTQALNEYKKLPDGTTTNNAMCIPMMVTNVEDLEDEIQNWFDAMAKEGIKEVIK